MTDTPTNRLRRIQSGARATLVLGIGASLAANVLAADPSLAGRVIAAWSPIALLLTVELLSRVPVTSGWLSRLRVTAAAAIAGIAAWVSYWHMVEVATSYGEATVAAHLLPLSVDGLVVVAAVCLVELADRLNLAAVADTPAAETVETEPHRAEQSAKAVATPRPATPPKPAGNRRNGSTSSPKGELVHRLAAEHPDWTQAQLAEEAGCSVRTVRRHLAAPTTEPDPISGPAFPTDQPTSTPVLSEVRPREEVSA